MTDQANPTLGKAERVFKDVAWDSLVKAALVSLHIDIWPVNSIFTLFTNALYEQIRTAVDLEAIAFLDGEHQKVFEKITVTLRVIGDEKGIESPEYRKAKDEARKAFASLVRYNA